MGFFYCTINTLGLVVNNFEPVFNKSLDSLGVTVTINLFILPTNTFHDSEIISDYQTFFRIDSPIVCLAKLTAQFVGCEIQKY